MTKEFIKKECKTIGWEILGSALIAIGIYNFALNAEFPMTGFSGISFILYRLFRIPIGVSTIVLNVPVAIMCYKLLGRGFFFRSLRCMTISAIFIDYVAPLFPSYEGDRFLAALCTGIIAGLGYAIIYMQNSSTGGTDFIIMAVKALRPYVSVGRIAFLSDIGIILVGGIIFKDIDGMIYGMIINFLFATAVDKVMFGINSGKIALIVTEHEDKITNIIEETTARGSTILKAVGGYKKNDKGVVLCACNNKQMYFLKKAVKEVDDKSFMMILETNEIHGEGFDVLQLGEKAKHTHVTTTIDG